MEYVGSVSQSLLDSTWWLKGVRAVKVKGHHCARAPHFQANLVTNSIRQRAVAYASLVPQRGGLGGDIVATNNTARLAHRTFIACESWLAK